MGCSIRASAMTEPAAAARAGAAPPGAPREHTVGRRLRHHPGAIAGAAVFAAIALAVLFGSFVHGVDPHYLDYRARNQGMSAEHPLGTDNLGRDTFARLLAGGRLSLAVGVAAMTLSLTAGTVVGVVAGFFPPPRQSADALDRPVPGAAGAAAADGQHHAVSRPVARRAGPRDGHLHPGGGGDRRDELDADGAHRTRPGAGHPPTGVRDRGTQHRRAPMAYHPASRVPPMR